MGRRASLTAAVAGACAVALAVTLSPAQAPLEVVWLEGEEPTAHTFNEHNWYCCAGVHGTWLSPGAPDGAAQGAWLSHYTDGGEEAEARYAFTTAVAGEHTVWMRVSSYRVRQWVQVDGGPEQELDLAADPREYFSLTYPDLDLRFLAWQRVGTYDLAPGPHQLVTGLRAHPAWGGSKVHGGIDALVVAAGRWTPSGAVRPDRPSPAPPGPADWFPVVGEDDPFDPASITDMSRYVEAPAGRHGPLRAVGDQLAFADGTPVKLWGIGASATATDALREQQARWYAKNGVNLVRLHPVEADIGLLRRDSATGQRTLDPQALDSLDRWFATLKARGIYMDWSPFYPHVVTPDDGIPSDLYAELPDATGGKSSSGFVAFVPELQEAEWAWLTQLLDHENPYTGLRYVNDPALAVVEVHNEDSVFWHFPLNDLAAGEAFPRHTAALQRGWAAWLRTRYANDAALRAAWGPPGAGSRQGDALANERMGIYGAWEMEADGPYFVKAEAARMGDFIRFLAETQRGYYAERGRRLRALGYEGVLVSTAWQSGGPAADAANVWTDDALDMIDRHNYVGGGAGNWRITTGAVNNETHLARAGSGLLASGLDQVEDKPFLMSEWDQVPPNQWKAEAAPLMAFYGLGLQGWDGLIHFHGARPRMGGGWPDLNSFVTETPHYIGQFPALALAVHRGDVAPGPLVAARRMATDDLFRGVDPLTQALPGLGYGGAFPSASLATPNEVLAIGRVTQKAGPGLPGAERVDWARYWDPATGFVRSATGELAWDAGRRVVTVASPRTQAVIGFAGGQTFDLPAFAVDVTTPFVSLLVSALDDRPLAESGHILVTALARDRQTGTRYNGEGTELLDTGAPPLLLEPVQARLRFLGPAIVSAQSVDMHGVPTGREVERTGNAVTIDGRYASYLYEVRRDVPATPSAVPSPTTPPTRRVRIALPALMKSSPGR